MILMPVDPMETQKPQPLALDPRLRLRLLTVMVLLSIAALVSFGWVSYENNQAAAALEVGSSRATGSALDQQLSQQQDQLSAAEARLEAANAEIAGLQATSAAQASQLAAASATQTAAQAKNEALAEDNARYQEQLQAGQAMADSMLAQLACVDTSYFKADYRDNSGMSAALKTYVGNIGGSNATATWSLLWNSSKTAIHRVTVLQDNHTFTNIFIVYFDEVDFSKHGVFWVNRACWLDRP
jgi:hypothetical protein